MRVCKKYNIYYKTNTNIFSQLPFTISLYILNFSIDVIKIHMVQTNELVDSSFKKVQSTCD